MYNESYGGLMTKKASPSYSVSKFSRNGEEIHTITGKDIEECQQRLFDKFGHAFQILNKKQILKPGFLGMFQKEYWEVTYSLEPVSKISQMSTHDSFKKNRDEILKSSGIEAASSAPEVTSAVTNTMQLASLDKKVEEFQKSMAKKLEEIAAATNSADKPISIQKVEELLQNNEFTFSYINKITTRLRSELSIEELDDFNLVQEKVVDWIGESIKIRPKDFHQYPHVIILVGPTGVGKTTTLAKLASSMILTERKQGKKEPRVQMITIDNTRVGAFDQINIYANLLDIKVAKADTVEDVRKLFETFKDSFDVVFIDTPGYSPNDSENIGKMKKMLELKGAHPDIYLTFTASAKARDMTSIIQNYEPFNFSSVIITKWDETTAIGNVISVLSEKGKTVSYITDGQHPSRIERATVLKFLLSLNDFNINREHIDEKFAEEN